MKLFYFYRFIVSVVSSLLLLAIIVLPQTVLAARAFIRAQTTPMAAEDKVMAEVRFNTEGKQINAVEGLVGLKTDNGSLYVRAIGLGGSDLTLWTNKPSVAPQSNSASISFTGGTPGGFNKTDALLFTIAFTVTAPGTVTILPVSLVAYANDGRGTPITVNNEDLSITVIEQREKPEDQWQNIIDSDKLPPEPFTIYMGHDPSVFDNKKFISFSAVDNQSGIDHYEIKEGNLGIVKSGTTYVLQDQILAHPITVYAFDRAGNVRSAEWSPATERDTFLAKGLLWPLSLIILLICCIIVWQWHQRTKKIKNS